jgi:hypothetical protein
MERILQQFQNLKGETNMENNEIMENVAETIEEVNLNVEDIPAANGPGVGLVLAAFAAACGVGYAAYLGVKKLVEIRKAKKAEIDFNEQMDIPGEGDVE